MRIGIDARFYGSIGKGLGRYTERLIEHLETLDLDDEYVVFLRRENFDEYVPKNFRFRKVLAQYRWYGCAEQLLFPFLLLRHRLDLMHFPHFNVPILYPGTFVVTLHDLILLHYPTLRGTTRPALLYWIKFAAYRCIIACALWRAARIITVSHFTERDILTHYPQTKEKIAVTYEAAGQLCPLSTPKEERRLFERLALMTTPVTSDSRDILEPYCLYVGNAYPHKNLEVFLDIAPLFPTERFVLVGKEDYFYGRLRKSAEERGIRNVVFAGFVNDRELSILYRFARCYVFPSLYEGFGLPPLEAMAYGVPVIASRAASLPEILGSAAEYFDPDDKNSLAGVLRSVLCSEEKRKDLTRRGYARAAEYSWERMAAETLVLYREAVR